MARLIRQHQPKLFDFAFALHKKDRVMAELGLPTAPGQAKPFLHVSGMFPPERGCLGVMWPLTSHPTNRNELLVWDLAHDPSELAGLNAAQVRERLFTRSDELPEGVERLPIKSIHLNKSPMVVGNLRTLRPELAERWGLQLEQAMAHAALAAALPDMSAIWREVFDRTVPVAPVDVDQDLYGGFLEQADRRRLNHLRSLDPSEPAWAQTGFDDERLPELVFRYRARNFPESLSSEEAERW